VEAQIEGQAQSHGIPREQVIRDVLLANQPNKRFATVEEIGASGSPFGVLGSGNAVWLRVRGFGKAA